MELTDPSDMEILTRISNGEKELYRIIMERHASLVFHVVYRFEKNEYRAEEVAQEIFIKAYERLSSFEGNSAFTSWLYRLAHNYCIDQSRRNKFQNSIFTEMPEDFSADRHADESNPDDNDRADEQTDRLQKALDGISDSLSVPLLMKYRDEMSYEAISKALNVPEGALKVRVHRARKELKKFLE